MSRGAAALVRGGVDAATAETWCAAIDAHPAWRSPPEADADFKRHASSLRLRAVAALDVAAIAASLVQGEVGAFCRRRLGDALLCDIDQCWARRQYAPAQAPQGHSAHAWHQDGALGFDFAAQSAPGRDALLAMVTCWIALTPCGAEAPGLELVADDIDALLPVRELSDAAVRARHDESALWRPRMRPGDALVFGGGVLHHTHVRPTMRRNRTSIELRYFAPGRLSDRLQGDRLVAIG